jgi:hypothetical protein
MLLAARAILTTEDTGCRVEGKLSRRRNESRRKPFYSPQSAFLGMTAHDFGVENCGESHDSRGDGRGTGVLALFPTRARLPLPLVGQINHLADVMLHVSGALYDHVEAVLGGGAHARILV